jgi:hypothetical protein
MRQMTGLGVFFLPVIFLFLVMYSILSPSCAIVLDNPTLEYSISPCDDCGLLLPHWSDGEINVSHWEQGLVFNQVLIYWCDFNPCNFTMQFQQEGVNITIIEQYADDGIVTDCLCPVKISGHLSPLAVGNYTITFKFEVTVYDLFRFTLPNGTSSEPTGEPISFRSSTLASIPIEIPLIPTSSPTSFPSNSSPGTHSSTFSVPTSSDTNGFSTRFAFTPLFLTIVVLFLGKCRKRSQKCQ